MKIIKTLFYLLPFVALTAFGAGTVPVTLGWTCAQADGPTNYVFKVYTSADATPPGTVLTTVTGVTNATVTVNRPSDQYLYVTVTDPRSNPTNYIAESEPSNIIRVRALGNGQLKVNSP